MITSDIILNVPTLYARRPEVVREASFLREIEESLGRKGLAERITNNAAVLRGYFEVRLGL